MMKLAVNILMTDSEIAEFKKNNAIDFEVAIAVLGRLRDAIRKGDYEVLGIPMPPAGNDPSELRGLPRRVVVQDHSVDFDGIASSRPMEVALDWPIVVDGKSALDVYHEENPDPPLCGVNEVPKKEDE